MVDLRCLKVIDCEGCYEQRLFDLNQEYPEFFPSIARMEYEGGGVKLKQYPRAILDRLEKCYLNVSSVVDFVPPTVKEMTLSNSSAQLTHSIERWPISFFPK